MRETYDLREWTAELTKAFPEIEALYLFGLSTDSLRSDVVIPAAVPEGSVLDSAGSNTVGSDIRARLDGTFGKG